MSPNIFNKHNKKNKKSASAIGVFFGPEGQAHDEAVLKQRLFYEAAAKVIKPCQRPFSELPAYLKDTFGAVQYVPSDKEREMFKTNLITTEFYCLIKGPVVIDQTSTLEELQNYVAIDNPFDFAESYPEDKLGLQMEFYEIKAVDGQSEKSIKVQLEHTTSYLGLSSNHEGKIPLKIMLLTGVSQEDIDNINVKFKQYASILRQLNGNDNKEFL